MSPWVAYVRFSDAGAKQVVDIQDRLNKKTLFNEKLQDANKQEFLWWNGELNNK